MKKRLKINGLIMFIAVVAIVFFPAIFFRRSNSYLYDGIMEITGIVLILLGQLLRVSARGYKSEHSNNSRSLIQGGPYALVRNPMYLGILLIGLGIVAILFKWWVVGIFLLVFIIRYQLLIFKEEKKLAALFPGTYQDYQRSVPRILPSISMIAKKDVGEYLPLKLSWLKKEIGSVLTVLFITLVLESWEDVKAEGIRAYSKE
ncbi:MAG: isoprenylcysteine carboxylmethyltransferase family protein, partial [Candidatus Omnitrophica bacterium]|nr:isoprenylcysteine carboxylmethyltransferase family protein [Candidatus Omnitrophota bacterium]